MTLPFFEKKEKEFATLLEKEEYEKALQIYEDSEDKSALVKLWQEEYHKQIKTKNFTKSLHIAERFSSDRTLLRQAATGLVTQTLREKDFTQAKKLLEKYPVNYVVILNTMQKIKDVSGQDGQKIREAIEPGIYQDSEQIADLLDRAAQKMRHHPYRHGYLLKLPEHCELMIAGDLHGNRINLDWLLAKAELESHPKRHLIFQEVIHSRSFLIDERDLSILEVIDILKYLVSFPDRVHFLLGNHDYNLYLGRETTHSKKRLNQLFKRGLALVFGKSADEILEHYLHFIEEMAAAIECASLVISHSNPEKIRSHPALFSSLEEKMPLAEHPYIPSLVFGREHDERAVDAFLEETHARFSIIGHEICPMGYECPSSHQIILDSCHHKGHYLLCQSTAIHDMKHLKQSLRMIRENKK